MADDDRPPSSASQRTRGRVGPFGALIVAAADDPGAARGLSSAYAAMATSARRQIIDAVVADATAEGISPAPALVALLTVEDDPALARRIADALNSAGGDGLRSTVAPRTMLAGDESRGGVLLIRPLHGTFVEVLALAWEQDRGVTHAIFDPLVDDSAATARLAQLPEGLSFELTPTPHAIDLLAVVLWSHRRRVGSLPPGVERFADLFGIPGSPLLDNI